MTEPETGVFRSKLRDLAEAKLRLYLPEMGEEFFAKLIANKANWQAGYAVGWDCYAVFPQTAFTREVKGQYILGPFTALKWTREELEALGVAVKKTPKPVRREYKLSPEQARAYLK